MDNTISGALFVPEVLKGDAEIFSVLLFIPHQELLSWFDGLTTTIENPSLILVCHEVLLLTVRSAIHIPENNKDYRRYNMDDEDKKTKRTVERQGKTTFLY